MHDFSQHIYVLTIYSRWNISFLVSASCKNNIFRSRLLIWSAAMNVLGSCFVKSKCYDLHLYNNFMCILVSTSLNRIISFYRSLFLNSWRDGFLKYLFNYLMTLFHHKPSLFIHLVMLSISLYWTLNYHIYL